MEDWSSTKKNPASFTFIHFFVVVLLNEPLQLCVWIWYFYPQSVHIWPAWNLFLTNSRSSHDKYKLEADLVQVGSYVIVWQLLTNTIPYLIVVNSICFPDTNFSRTLVAQKKTMAKTLKFRMLFCGIKQSAILVTIPVRWQHRSTKSLFRVESEAGARIAWARKSALSFQDSRLIRARIMLRICVKM